MISKKYGIPSYLIKNVRQAVLRDGYDYYITIDKQEQYGIQRIYPNCLLNWNGEKAIYKASLEYTNHCRVVEISRA